MDLQSLSLDVHLQLEVKAPIQQVFEGLIHRMTVANVAGGNAPMPMVMERRPGGRWYRDLGNDTGHCWGFVQSIKPPTLLELNGPMFMSYPVAGHIMVRISEIPGGAKIDFRHRAFGFIDEQHRAGVSMGWGSMLDDVRSRCETK